MPIALQKNVEIICPRIKTPFLGSGGAAPYAYSVLAGGAGGTIDALTGLYTAPNSIGGGVDTIKVIDNISEEITNTINIVTPIGALCKIIETSMGLGSGQVYLYNQKFNIPTDQNLYIAVGFLTCKPFSNVNKFDPVLDQSFQSTNFKAAISIHIMSKSFIAMERKEEVVMALNSDYSQQIQEANNFSIGKIPSSFVNLSQEDGARIPFAFNITVNLLYAVVKTQAATSFGTFLEPIINVNK